MSGIDSILELNNVRKVYKGDLLKKKHVAVESLTCRFQRGKCTGLLGHNGAGKTTAIRMIFGLVRPDQGSILFNGQPIGLKEKAQLGYMPEINKLPTALTPQEILSFHLQVFAPSWLKRRDYKSEIEKTLKLVGLWDARHRKVKKLSKGMGRRLAWAQATIHRPEFVILDEPFSGLDPLARHDLLGWVLDFKRSGKSLLLCTHELWSTENLCDEIYVLKGGKLVFSSADSKDSPLYAAVTGARYSLHVSGVKPDDLQKLGSRFNLKPWAGISHGEFLCKIRFDDYNIAANWLKACVDQGFIVVKFSDEISIDDSDLMDLFRGGRVQP